MRLCDKALPNDEAKLKALIVGLKAQEKFLLVVDQPATIWCTAGDGGPY